MKINALHIWYKKKAGDDMFVHILKPVPTSTLEMKIAVAKTLLKVGMKHIQYYYVVAEAKLSGGRKGYRTIVGKVTVG